MAASWCPHCQEIAIVDYSEVRVLEELVTTITCTQCHKELSRRWEKISDIKREYGFDD